MTVPSELFGNNGALVGGLVWVVCGAITVAVRASRYSPAQIRWRLLGIVVFPAVVMLTAGIMR